MKKKSINSLIDTEDIFNIGLFAFTIAAQMNPNLMQIALYVFFIFAFFVNLHAQIKKSKNNEQELVMFILDFIKALTLPLSLAFLGLAFSFNSFWLASTGVSLFVLFAAISWSLWNLSED
ncbi:hypothetical protein ACRN9G_18945 [Shewanella frigidimarina]|uniref:hypothetical protein n=1 Tax=Shewanella frigidimarina TaxID=56812 RepID=UPI003D795530